MAGISQSILSDYESISKNEAFCALTNAMPDMVLLTNSQRKVVYVNKTVKEISGFESTTGFLDRHPGEIISCINQISLFDVCGFHQNCSGCELNCQLINKFHDKTTQMHESKIISLMDGVEKQFDFLITTTPTHIDGKEYLIVIIKDISAQKRKQALERIFFHDIINLAGSLNGIIKLVTSQQSKEIFDKYLPASLRLSGELMDEINSQRDISLAEVGELAIKNEWVNSIQVISHVEEMLTYYKESKDKQIRIDEQFEDVEFISDKRILERILLNMGKNALESSTTGEYILLECKKGNGTVTFSVYNSKPIEPEIQSRVFHRSFSTKGTNRGLGTYSMKLLGEGFLGGKVWFKSHPQEGTRFFLSLPA
jgi:nitrogen-specific signal transduction histidine kinase